MNRRSTIAAVVLAVLLAGCNTYVNPKEVSLAAANAVGSTLDDLVAERGEPDIQWTHDGVERVGYGVYQSSNFLNYRCSMLYAVHDGIVSDAVPVGSHCHVPSTRDLTPVNRMVEDGTFVGMDAQAVDDVRNARRARAGRRGDRNSRLRAGAEDHGRREPNRLREYHRGLLRIPAVPGHASRVANA